MYTLAFPIIAPTLVNRIVLVIPFCPLVLGAWELVRLGFVRFAAGLLQSGIWLVMIYAALASGGVRAPAQAGTIIVLLAAAALLGRRAIIVFATLSVWTGLLMVYADQANWLLPYNVFVTPLQEWLADTIFYCYWDVVLSCVQ